MKCILAVDDDLATRELYKALLTEAGYAVRTAEDATSALIVFRDYAPDLVILDVEMPAGGGGKAFDMIRDVLGSGVPVLFITGIPARVVPLVARRANVRLLRKPAKNNGILSAVSEMLECEGTGDSRGGAGSAR